MNGFFKSAWSFVLSSVIKTQNIHEDKVNPEVASCLDSYDLALTQKQRTYETNPASESSSFIFTCNV